MKTLAGAGNQIETGTFSGMWRDLPATDRPDVAAVVAADQMTALSAVWTHLRLPFRETLVVHETRVDDRLCDDLLANGLTVIGRVPGRHLEPSPLRPSSPGRLWLTTSGSTGRPKLVAHSFRSLTTVSSPQPPRRWLLPYGPGTYAWWHLVTLSLTHPGQDLVPLEVNHRLEWLDTAVGRGVNAVSATPSFWRRALWRYGEDLRVLPLKQITLGGEPVDQPVLDRLLDCFPSARISWVYASSEVGASFAVHDGRAGFPVQWLNHTKPGCPQVHVANGELLINSPHHAIGYSAADGRGQLDGHQRVHAELIQAARWVQPVWFRLQEPGDQLHDDGRDGADRLVLAHRRQGRSQVLVLRVVLVRAVCRRCSWSG